MGILIVATFFVCSLWLLISLLRRLRRIGFGGFWWLGLAVMLSLGSLAGYWCAFHFEYQAGARYRIGSFPIPVVFFHLEDGQWVDFPVPEFQAWATVYTNILMVAAVFALPHWCALLWLERRQLRALAEQGSPGNGAASRT